MLLLFLILLFSYSGKTVWRTSKVQGKDLKKSELNVSKTKAVKTNQFFQLKPRIFPITLHGRVPKKEKSNLRQADSIAKNAVATEELDFVFSAPVPWYQYYYFPGGEEDYSAAS